MKITVRNLPNFGLAVLFAGAFFALAITSLRPFFRPSATGTLGSSKAPVWELKDPNGKLVKSSDFDGKVVILDFWATWCPPCKAEIPGFIDLQKKYGEKGLVVVGVSVDEQGSSVVKQFMKEFAMNYPVVMGNLKMMQDFGVREYRLPLSSIGAEKSSQSMSASRRRKLSKRKSRPCFESHAPNARPTGASGREVATRMSQDGRIRVVR